MQAAWRTVGQAAALAAGLFACAPASAHAQAPLRPQVQPQIPSHVPPAPGQPTAGQSAKSFPTLDAHVPVSPAPLVGGGRTHLVYELYLANLSPREMTLEAIDVRDPAMAESDAPLLRLEGGALDAAIQRAGVPVDASHKRVLQGGQLAIVFVWVTLPVGAQMPAALTHRFAIHVVEPIRPPAQPQPTAAAKANGGSGNGSGGNGHGSGDTKAATGNLGVGAGTSAGNGTGMGTGTRASIGAHTLTVDGVTVRVTAHAPRIIGSPLQGDGWLAANGPDNSTGHRRALIALAGQGRISQRYAIDWIQLYDNGKTWKGDPLKNASYRCYGANALAVADGVVVDTQDGIPQNVPGATSRAVPITPETLGGNFVLLDIGQGAYAYYAHLQPGSLRVRKGDTVQRGQVLGLVGNSGNSTEPHLHFHLADRNAAIDSEGLPYAFDTFELQAPPDRVTAAMKQDGESLAIDASVMNKLATSPPLVRHDEIPMMNAIVRFAATAR